MEREPGWTLRASSGTTWNLGEGAHRVGRGRDNRIVLDDAGVSRVHAELLVEQGRLSLRDLGSSNGCFVDGRRVSAATLRGGERLGFGPSCTLQLSEAGGAGTGEAREHGRILGLGCELCLRPGVWRIGRAQEADLVLEDPSVSRQHLELEVTLSGQVSLRDLASGNGSFVDGRRVTKATLRGGERLHLGGVELRYLPPAWAAAATRVDGPPVVSVPPPARPAAPPRPVVSDAAVAHSLPPASAVSRPVAARADADSGASGWIWGVLLVLGLLGGGAWYLHTQAEPQGVGVGGPQGNESRTAGSAEERRRREQAALRERAVAVARDPAFERRLAELAETAGRSGEIFARFDRAASVVDDSISGIRNLPLGTTALNRAGLGDFANVLQGMSRDLSAVSASVNGMDQSAERLRVGVQRYRASGDEAALRALGAPAADAARQAGELGSRVRDYRRQLQRVQDGIGQVASLADRVGLGRIAGLTRDAARPMAALSSYLGGVQDLVERDMQNLRLLEQAAGTF